MNQKPITPAAHAIIDYAFGVLQIVGPAVMRLDSKPIKTYAQLGTGMLAVSSATDTPITIQPAISMETHKKIDTGLLAVQALMLLTPMIRKNRKTLLFHLGLMALSVANYLLTDYRTDPATSKLPAEKDATDTYRDLPPSADGVTLHETATRQDQEIAAVSIIPV